MICNFCGKEYQTEDGRCPYCNQQPAPQMYQPAPVVAAPKKKSKLPVIIIAIVLVAVIIAGVMIVPGLIGGDKNKLGGKQDEEPAPVEIVCISAIDIETLMNMQMSMDIEYNENGYPSRIYMVSDGESADAKTEYNEADYTYKTQSYENGILVEESISECDDMWREKKTTTYVDGEETSYTVIEYNGDGERSKETVYEYGTESESTVYEYNSDGKLVKETVYYLGTVSNTSVYTYDESGLLIKRARDYADGTSTERVYTYDDKGLCTKIVYYENGTEAGYDEFTYNESGKVESRDTYMMGMKMVTMKLEYITVKVPAKHAESLAENQADIINEIDFFS